MRIRNFHAEDLPTLIAIQQAATRQDNLQTNKGPEAFASWLLDPHKDAVANAFVVTDDDDELNTWGQAGTLEGIEGEIVGFTLIQLDRRGRAYYLLCQGAVHPLHRRRHAGRALLICALNRARMLAAEFEFEAEQAGDPVYFAALLPTSDPTAPALAAKCELVPTDEAAPAGLQLYKSLL